jgi:hypothetical protein
MIEEIRLSEIRAYLRRCQIALAERLRQRLDELMGSGIIVL